MSHPMSRRSFTAGGVAMLLGASSALAFPQIPISARPVRELSGSGLPTLVLSLDADTYYRVPQEIQAGRYLVTIDIADDVGSYIGTEFIHPPQGMSAHEFLVVMGLVAGSPVIPTPESSTEGFPSFIYASGFAGGPVGWPGENVQAVVDLTPGEWIVLADGEHARQPPVVITAIGSMPGNVATPDADISTTLVDFAMKVEGDLAPGTHVMRVQNQGTEPHFLLLGRGPDTMTIEQVAVSLAFGPDGSGLNLATDVTMTLLSSTQSRGTQQWLPVMLEPGVYVGTCTFPAAGGWSPHTSHGMFTVFTVG